MRGYGQLLSAEPHFVPFLRLSSSAAGSTKCILCRDASPSCQPFGCLEDVDLTLLSCGTWQLVMQQVGHGKTGAGCGTQENYKHRHPSMPCLSDPKQASTQICSGHCLTSSLLPAYYFHTTSTLSSKVLPPLPACVIALAAAVRPAADAVGGTIRKLRQPYSLQSKGASCCNTCLV